MNSISIDGRLGKDPEPKTLPSGKTVVNFSIAHNQSKENTDWFDCTAWDRSAEFIVQYFRKGDGINVEGSLRKEYWDKDGEKREKVIINVGRVSFPLSRPSDSGGRPAVTPATESTLSPDDIPF